MNRRSPQILAPLLAALAATQSTQAAEPQPLYTSKTVHATPVEIHADLHGAKELYLMVTDAGDGFNADWAEWMEPTLTTSAGTTIKLTTLKPKFSKVGFGKLEIDARSDGLKPMKVDGKEVPFGFAAHAPSVIGFDLPEGVVAFAGRGGIDEAGVAQGAGATVVFKVYAQNPGERVLASVPSQGSDKPYGFEAAREQMKDFTTAKGLEAGLFAAEPKIQNPTNIDIDPKGRVWAVEAVNYRGWDKLRPEGDRVVILEDTKGDGVADKETTFWQAPELKWPLGICVLPQEGNGRPGTKVIVSAAPNVWLLEDTKGDDKADKVTKLFTVGGNPNHDHNVHAFRFGADGKLYFNMGNEGQKLMWPDGSLVKDMAGNEVATNGKPYRQGLVLRCDFDANSGKVSHIETLGWNFRNNFELCVDSFGTIWQSDNDDDGNKGVRINYVMDYGNYGYADEMTGAGWGSKRTNMEAETPLRHWHLNDPGVVPNLLQTGGGSPTGIVFNEGSLLGAAFTNEIIHCDAGPRVVRSYTVTPDGAGYKAAIVNVLESSDSWYRPSDLSIAPDGSLFVADWYDSGVGGHAMGDHEAGHIRGRIYRVAPQAGKYTAPKLDLSTAAGAVTALQSPNKATQYVAWQKLHALAAGAEPALTDLWKSENPRLRARALELLGRLPGSGERHIAAAITDADPDIRITAIRLVRELRVNNPEQHLPEAGAALAKLVADEKNPQVNRELALLLAIVPDRPSIAETWVQLARKYDGKDRWYLEALGIAARGAEDACFDAWIKSVGTGWNTPPARDILWRLRSVKTAPLLAKLIEDPNTSEAEAPRYLREFDFLPAGEQKTAALVELASLGTANKFAATEALERLKNVDLTANPQIVKAISAMVTASRGTPQFVELVRDFKLKDQGEGLLEIALKGPKTAEGVEAAKMLLGTDYAPVIGRALKTPHALALVEVLGNTADQRAVPILASIMKNLGEDAAVRKQAVKALAQSPAGVAALLKLARDNVFPADLKLTATTALASVQLPQSKAEIAQLFPAPSAAGGHALPPISELVKIRGDVARGKAIFEKEQTTCITCHRVGALGADFGPALSEIGTKLGKDAIYEAIIDPNAGISMGFETTMLTMKDGNVGLGIVRSDTEDEVVLAMPQGVQNRYKKADIAKREKLPVSMMPTGLQQALTTQELVDLVDYLSSLKAPAK